jgi:hypothetical protein
VHVTRQTDIQLIETNIFARLRQSMSVQACAAPARTHSHVVSTPQHRGSNMRVPAPHMHG